MGKDLCEVHGWERVCVQGGLWKGCEVVKEILGFDSFMCLVIFLAYREGELWIEEWCHKALLR